LLGPNRYSLNTRWNLLLSWSPDSTHLASCANGPAVFIWEVKSGTLVKTLSCEGIDMMSVAWSPAANLLAAISFPGGVYRWDVETWERHRIAPSEPTEMGLGWSPTGKVLAFEHHMNILHLWDLETEKVTRFSANLSIGVNTPVW